MKCYICLTDSIVNRKDYFNMLKVTLISARKNTSLRLICLYDGKIGDPVYNLLKDFKVEIIIHELPYKKELMEIYSHEWMETELGKDIEYTLNPQLHSRSATYKRNGLLIRKTAIKSSRPFQCAYYPLTP